MKISKIKVSNYRLLKSLDLDVEDDLSLIVGRNNCGKTSLLNVLNKFLGKNSGSPKFSYFDFNVDLQKELTDIYTNLQKYNKLSNEENNWENLGITLKLFIEYNENDSLANISNLMMDLDPNNNMIVLLFEYVLDFDNFKKLKEDFDKYVTKKRIGQEKITYYFTEFMKRNSNNYFKVFKKSIAYDCSKREENENEVIDLKEENISLEPIINFKLISANRDVSNKESNSSLSSLASQYYEKLKGHDEENECIKKFENHLEDTDSSLNDIYKGIYKDVVDKVKKFGGVNKNDSVISVNSTLHDKELLKSNATVMYESASDCLLPESYNGLGYLNLISMIFELELLIHEFRKTNSINTKPADINLLFIEEPEAHTHPQMQYVFIKNIKEILNSAKNGTDHNDDNSNIGFNLQTLITSHSSHIVSQSDFNDIKYFLKVVGKNEIKAKNLKELERRYEDDQKQYYKFLKQYLTLKRAELFFTDKAIFIEGDTERLLLPAMMKKIDSEDSEKEEKNELPLMSQNISIIEVGAYSHIFHKFFDFIGVKSLVITDLDATKNREKCKVEEGSETSNAALNFYFKNDSTKSQIEHLTSLKFSEKVFKFDKDLKLKADESGQFRVAYQIKETNDEGVEYCARSFEDAFIHLNREFINENKTNFESLKNSEFFDDSDKDAYDLAESCVDKKTTFAIEILLHSVNDNNHNEESRDWSIPKYIKEGLSWLKEN